MPKKHEKRPLLDNKAGVAASENSNEPDSNALENEVSGVLPNSAHFYSK